MGWLRTQNSCRRKDAPKDAMTTSISTPWFDWAELGGPGWHVCVFLSTWNFLSQTQIPDLALEQTECGHRKWQSSSFWQCRTSRKKVETLADDDDECWQLCSLTSTGEYVTVPGVPYDAATGPVDAILVCARWSTVGGLRTVGWTGSAFSGRW